MEIYRAYFRDDPAFDQTNLTRAIPQLPCPKVDRDLLVRTGSYAMDTNFGWPRPPLPHHLLRGRTGWKRCLRALQLHQTNSR